MYMNTTFDICMKTTSSICMNTTCNICINTTLNTLMNTTSNKCMNPPYNVGMNRTSSMYMKTTSNISRKLHLIYACMRTASNMYVNTTSKARKYYARKILTTRPLGRPTARLTPQPPQSRWREGQPRPGSTISGSGRHCGAGPAGR